MGHALSSVVISHFPVIARVAMLSAFLTVISNGKKGKVILKKYQAVELKFVTCKGCTNSIDINSGYIYIYISFENA